MVDIKGRKVSDRTKKLYRYKRYGVSNESCQTRNKLLGIMEFAVYVHRLNMLSCVQAPVEQYLANVCAWFIAVATTLNWCKFPQPLKNNRFRIIIDHY